MKGKWVRRVLAGVVSAAMCCTMMAGCGGGDMPETNVVKMYNLVPKYPLMRYVEYQFQVDNRDIGFDYRMPMPDFSTTFMFGSDMAAKGEEAAKVLQQYYDGMSIEILKGECEDIVMADTFYQLFDDVTPPDYNKMIRAGGFTDLKPLLAEYAPEIDLSVYDSLLIDGKLYAVPINRGPYCIYSAEKLLEQWDFDLNPKDDILTFLRKCATWKAAHAEEEDAPEVFTKLAWNYIYMNIFNIVGLDVVNYTEGTANFDDARMKEVLELLRELKSDVGREVRGDELLWNSPAREYGLTLFSASCELYDAEMLRAYGGNYMNDLSVLMPLLQLDGKTATSSNIFLMIPDTAANKRNAAKYIATYLKAIYTLQTEGGTLLKDFYYCYPDFVWENDEAAFESYLTQDKKVYYASADYADTIRNMYHNQGDILMPPYWFCSLQYLFDNYMAGKISIDTLASDVQSRLEIYVTE